MKYILYGNGGSGNHGCEAIVRGTKALLGGDARVHSAAVSEDQRYGLTEIAEVVPAHVEDRRSLRFLSAYLRMKLTGSYIDLDVIRYLASMRAGRKETEVALSVGGDNYCYSGTEIYRYLNTEYHKMGFKTVLWGCSVEPDIVRDAVVAEDLRRYNLIVARESITHDAIKEIGANVILAPDPAFYMSAKPCDMDVRLMAAPVIGVNISPHILKCASDRNTAYENYLELIRYILRETDAVIALIPHVVWESNDDRRVLQQLYEDAGRSDRIVLVEDHTAPELKHIISQCRVFIGARTHATIAAYSSCVPTIVVGYSVKARGIAKDLFGTEEKYVLPVQGMHDPMLLTETFKWIYENQESVRTHLRQMMPDYLSGGMKAKEKVLSLFEQA